ncbi:hypothetical protein KM043_012540 [Ampulex compressa]|nr:hypothetical protein KM043_012540 [Ampulex compressa]
MIRLNKYLVTEKYRVYASISFAILLLGLGVPLWWHTTAVPRVTLPYSGIDDLSNIEIRINTRIVVAALSQDRAKLLAREIEKAYEDVEIYDLDVVHRVVHSAKLSTASIHHELETIASSFDLRVGDLLLLETVNLKDATLVGSKRALYFSPETSAEKLVTVLSQWMLHERSLALTKNALTEPTLYSLDVENRRRFPASPAYDILITVVNPDPQKLKVNWDLRTVAEEYIEPYLSRLSILSNFSVKSQWLYLLPLDVNPTKIVDDSPLGRHFVLAEDVLPQLITPLEKKLASQVSLRPTINFVLYTVPCDSGPLHIYPRNGRRSKTDTKVQAFLSPRWGGVMLINPPIEACMYARNNEAVTIVPEETTVVEIFLAQLRLLIGIPEPTSINGVTAVPLVGLNSRDWEVDALLRVRTIEQLTSAKLTLQSLAQLLKEISNIVITDVVGNRIKTALHLVQSSAEALKHGDLMQGFLLSKEAFVTAEAAFSDPTLLALLYFPEDQKYAVYIPLFLPAMIPVLLSLKKIYRYYFSNKDSVNKKSNVKKETNERAKDRTLQQE